MTTPAIEFERGLPASIDTERSILGGILLDANAYHEAAEKLRSDDFALDSHRRIFKCFELLARSKRAIDIVTLGELLQQRKETESVGGMAYIFSLTEGLPRRLSIAEYVRIVKEKSMLRQAIGACSKAITRAADQSEDAQAVISESIRDLEDVLFNDAGDSDLESIGQYVANTDVLAARQPGIMTGFAKYDEMTYGLHRGELTIVAGRTSMGKTAFAASLVRSLGKRNVAVAAFVNEQKKQSFLGRMLCGHTHISFKRYRRNDLSDIERHYIRGALEEFRMLPIFWDFRSNMGIPSIRAKSQRLKRTEGLDDLVVVIDQLSGLNFDGIAVEKGRSDVTIGRQVKALQNMANDLDVPVVLFVQVGRGAIKNQSHRPTLADLAESGKLEQHADNVAFVHRPSYYDRESQDDDEVILAKQRDGETGVISCRYVAECTSWEDL